MDHLQRLLVDILKIDRSFIGGGTGSAEESALARAIVNLSQTLGLETVAEGIETAEQLAILRELGCQLGQGYHLARPLGPAAVDALLGRQHPGIGTPNRTHPPRNLLTATLPTAGITRKAARVINQPAPSEPAPYGNCEPGNEPRSITRDEGSETAS